MSGQSQRELLSHFASGFLLLALGAVLSGCASAPKQIAETPLLTWPPEGEPRIQFVQAIQSARDFGIKPSAASRIGRFFTGRSKATDQFDKPFGIAVGERGVLYITDTSTASISVLDLERRKLQVWSKFDKLKLLTPVAVAHAGQILFVADSSLGEVLAVNEDGKIVRRIKDPLVRPAGLAARNDRLYVVDSQLHSVFTFDLAGTLQSRMGKRGSAEGELNFPTHVAVNAEGEIFVTDSMNSRVAVFSAEGAFLRQIGSVGDTSGHFSRPKGLAIDPGGRVYVLDALFDNIQIFDKEGKFLLDMGKAGADPGEFWLPNGIAINEQNEIFVTDSYNKRVQIFKYVGPP